MRNATQNLQNLTAIRQSLMELDKISSLVGLTIDEQKNLQRMILEDREIESWDFISTTKRLKPTSTTEVE